MECDSFVHINFLWLIIKLFWISFIFSQFMNLSMYGYGMHKIGCYDQEVSQAHIFYIFFILSKFNRDFICKLIHPRN